MPREGSELPLPEASKGLKATRTIGRATVLDVPAAVVGGAIHTTGLPALAEGFKTAREHGDNLGTSILHGAFNAAGEVLMPLATTAEKADGDRRGLRRFADVATALGAVGVAAAVREPSVAHALPDAVRALADMAPHVAKTAPIAEVAGAVVAGRNFLTHTMEFARDNIRSSIDSRRIHVGRSSKTYRHKYQT